MVWKIRRPKFSGPTIFIGLALLILPMWGAYVEWPAFTAGIAYALIFAGCAFALWYFRKELSLGTKLIWIPLVVLVFFAKDVYSLFMVGMFLLFLVMRAKGDSVFWIIPVLVVFYSTSVIVDFAMNPGARASGFSTNPNIVAALLVVSIFLLRGRMNWLFPLPLAAIAFTGSYWALGALTVCLLVKLVRPGLGIAGGHAGLAVIAVVVVLVVGMVWGSFSRTWNFDKVETMLGHFVQGEVVKGVDSATGRLDSVRLVRDDFNWFGNGYRSTERVYEDGEHFIIHNVPLMITDEMGPFAAAAWLFTMGYAIYKSRRYRYALIAMTVVSVTGCFWYWHWSSLAPFYWILMGLVSKEVDSSDIVSLNTY